MGVYIKGMEMPESCLECPFKWAGDSTIYCLAQTPTMKSLMPVKLHEIRWKKFSNAVEKFRWKEASCPLVPVPPHGRLIDADALVADLRRQCKEVFKTDAVSPDDFWIIRDQAYNERLWTTWCESLFAYLKTAPTIIPAEEGE